MSRGMHLVVANRFATAISPQPHSGPDVGKGAEDLIESTVHLKRPRLNLRDLLECRANIDFAYQPYKQRAYRAS
jgi:hypothetical protein